MGTDPRFAAVYDATGGARAQEVLEIFGSQGRKAAALSQQVADLKAAMKARRGSLREMEKVTPRALNPTF